MPHLSHVDATFYVCYVQKINLGSKLLWDPVNRLIKKKLYETAN